MKTCCSAFTPDVRWRQVEEGGRGEQTWNKGRLQESLSLLLHTN